MRYVAQSDTHLVGESPKFPLGQDYISIVSGNKIRKVATLDVRCGVK